MTIVNYQGNVIVFYRKTGSGELRAVFRPPEVTSEPSSGGRKMRQESSEPSSGGRKMRQERSRGAPNATGKRDNVGRCDGFTQFLRVGGARVLHFAGGPQMRRESVTTGGVVTDFRNS